MKTVGFYVAVLSSVKEISGRIGRYPGCRMLHRDDIGKNEERGYARAERAASGRSKAGVDDSGRHVFTRLHFCNVGPSRDSRVYL
jgi:hypothetical protein